VHSGNGELRETLAMRERLWLRLVVSMLVLVVIGGPPSLPHAYAQPLDPAQPGPFAVGITERLFTRSSSTTGAPRTIRTLVWYPAQAGAPTDAVSRFGGTVDAAPARAAGPFPALLFSHGSGGTPWQSSFLTVHLASQGFVVIAPSHPGNTVNDCELACLPLNAASRTAFLDSAANRPADISAALDNGLALADGTDEQLAGMFSRERIGVLGHSFGGWTALEMLGRDQRFKAAAPMAPGVFAELLAIARRVTAPTLVLAGDLDRLTRIADEQELSLSLKTGGGDHWFVVLHGAGHLSFTDLCGRIFGGCGPSDLSAADAQSAIKGWMTAFLDRYVSGSDRYGTWLNENRPPFLEVTYTGNGSAVP
jgi:predicted dienelactone hydrolase